MRLSYWIVLTGLFLSFDGYATTQPTFLEIALTPTDIVLQQNATAQVQYQVTNLTRTTRLLTMVPVSGASVVSGGVNACTPPFQLAPNQSCTLTLQLTGSQLATSIIWPTICKATTDASPDPFLCSRPSAADSLKVTIVPPFIEIAGGVNQSDNLPLLMQTVDGGQQWTVIDVSDAPSGGQFFNTTCQGSSTTAYCLAAGGTPDGDPTVYVVPPFIAQTNNGGTTWSMQTVVGAPALGNFYGASCYNSLCVAVGDTIVYTSGSITSSPPLIAQTLDKGAHWATQAITGGSVPANASFISASCTNGQGDTPMCVGVGQVMSAPGDLKSTTNNPFLAQTLDEGASWSVIAVSDAPTYGYFYHVSCTHNNNDGFCAAVGQNYTGTIPIVAQTTNSGSQWRMVTVPTGTGYLNDVSCDGAVCVGVGTTFEGGGPTYQPLIFQTTNGGISWSVVTDIPGIESITNGMLYTVNCSGSGANTLCVAGGADYDTGYPILLQTTDAGANWSIVTIPGVPVGSFNTVVCTGTLPASVCNAVGEDDTNSANNPLPLIAQTSDGGANWSVVNMGAIPGAPAQGVLYWSAATGGVGIF